MSLDLALNQVLTSNDSIVVGVTTDPKSKDDVWDIHTQNAIGNADASRNKVVNFLEVKRGMCRILFESFEILSGEFLGCIAATRRSRPRSRARPELQNCVDLPLL
jgi:hypothetical protein